MIKPRGIQNTTLPADRLVRMFLDGEIRLPEIQRRYIWPREKVRALLDSIYKEYPSGSILLWRTDRPVDTRQAATAADSGATGPAGEPYLLLDGQQRLTSLAAILGDAPIRTSARKGGRPARISIYFNMDHPESVTSPDTEDDRAGSIDEDAATDHSIFRLETRAVVADPLWIPVTELFRDGPVPTLSRTGIDPGDPSYQKYLARLVGLQRAASYQYPVQILDKSVSYEEVTDIFVRVNSQGTKLRKADLALAQVTSRWKGSMDLFTDAVEALRKRRFSLDEGFLIRCLISVSTGQSKFANTGRIPIETLREGLGKTTRGLDFAIRFLKNDARIETTDVLHSPFLLVPLVCLAVKKDCSFTSETKRKALRWAYAALMWGRYSRGSVETMLDEDLAIIRGSEDPLEEMIGRIAKQSGRLRVTEADLEGKKRQSPLFSMMYVLARKGAAKDWHSGLTLTVDSDRDFDLMHGHVFPRNSIAAALGGGRTPQDVGPLFADMCNTVFLSRDEAGLAGKTPDEYLPAIVERMGEEALVAQCIPTDRSLWSADRYEEFLAARRRAVADGINSLLEALEAPLPPPSPADCAAVIRGGETSRVEFKSSMLYDYKRGASGTAPKEAILKGVAALMNAGGGIVYVGVSDEGKILGLGPDYKLLGRHKDWDGWSQAFVSVLGALGMPAAALVTHEPVEIDGRTIAKITVKRGRKQAWLETPAGPRLAVRQGTCSTFLDAKNASEYIQVRFQ